MASDYDQPISDQEKVRIASDFILHSPPGEFNEVFSDVRVLLDNDALLKDSVSRAAAQYNKNQHTPVKIEGADNQALITEFNDLGGNKFLDPRSRQTFTYDHLRKEASNYEQCEDTPTGAESWRKALEHEFTNYAVQHYKHGVCSIFSRNDGGNITLTAVIEDHQFQPKNFWNGRWRSQWTITFSPSDSVTEIKGILKVQVHYYEDGNVQLVTSKEIIEQINISNEEVTASEFCRIVEDAENEYQTALSENYQTMSDTTFKALRRQLPVTRTKMDWNKILNYRIGSELRNH